MEEDKVVLPVVTARIEQTVHIPVNLSSNHLPLGGVAEWTCPGKVVEVIGAASWTFWRKHWQTTTHVVFPTRGWNDVVYMELSSCWHQTVFTGVMRS